MNFSLGGVKRGLLAFAAVLLLSVTITACSGDDKPSAPKTTATVDPKVADEAAVEDLVDRYWAAIVKAENAANPDPAQFKPVAKGTFIERELNRLRTYENGDIHRVGKPAITEVEADVTGDAAKIKACLDEDEWGAEHKGKMVPPTARGAVAWGATAERIGDAWLVTEVAAPEGGSKEC